jgi:hypothetical protein
MRRFLRLSVIFYIITVFLTAQDKPKSILPGPDRSEGEGPFKRLVIRGATVIDGSGAPPKGPVDIVIEGNILRRFVAWGIPVFLLMKNVVPNPVIMKLTLTAPM